MPPPRHINRRFALLIFFEKFLSLLINLIASLTCSAQTRCSISQRSSCPSIRMSNFAFKLSEIISILSHMYLSAGYLDICVLDLLSLTEYWKWARNWHDQSFLPATHKNTHLPLFQIYPLRVFLISSSFDYLSKYQSRCLRPNNILKDQFTMQHMCCHWG